MGGYKIMVTNKDPQLLGTFEIVYISFRRNKGPLFGRTIPFIVQSIGRDGNIHYLTEEL